MPDSTSVSTRVEQLREWLETPNLTLALRQQCHCELNQLRRLWQNEPSLFSTQSLRVLKGLADQLKTSQLDAVKADDQGVRAIDVSVSSADHVLKTVFGYNTFRPGQRELIEEVLSGRDAVGIMPTGAGK